VSKLVIKQKTIWLAVVIAVILGYLACLFTHQTADQKFIYGSDRSDRTDFPVCSTAKVSYDPYFIRENNFPTIITSPPMSGAMRVRNLTPPVNSAR
jgi:hypothetical protein